MCDKFCKIIGWLWLLTALLSIILGNLYQTNYRPVIELTDNNFDGEILKHPIELNDNNFDGEILKHPHLLVKFYS